MVRLWGVETGFPATLSVPVSWGVGFCIYDSDAGCLSGAGWALAGRVRQIIQSRAVSFGSA